MSGMEERTRGLRRCSQQPWFRGTGCAFTPSNNMLYCKKLIEIEIESLARRGGRGKTGIDGLGEARGDEKPTASLKEAGGFNVPADTSGNEYRFQELRLPKVMSTIKHFDTSHTCSSFTKLPLMKRALTTCGFCVRILQLSRAQDGAFDRSFAAEVCSRSRAPTSPFS